MKPTVLLFHFEEAFKNVRRNGLMSLAALSTVAVAMAVLGGALYSIYRLHQFAQAQPRQLEMEAFLVVGTDKQQLDQTLERIQKMPEVASVRLYPKEKAWEELKQESIVRATDLDNALDKDNPLPDRLDVHLIDAAKTTLVSSRLMNKTEFPNIAHLLDAHQILDRLTSLSKLVTNLGIAASVALILATSLVIQNTIRLTVYARRKEIRIMQLVGATPGFIRFPMVLEGIAYGALGSILAGILVLVMARQTSQYTGTLASPLMKSLPEAIAPLLFLFILVLMGSTVGLTGSVISLRRFLKRI